MAKVALLVNAHSRTGREKFEESCSALRNAGLDIESHLVDSLAESRRILESKIAEKSPMVICGGGDGTLSSCASILAGTETALGVLPLGTGNTFALGLKMPLQIAAAAEVLAKGTAAHVDVGRVNGRIFINSVSIGASAHIAAELDPELKRKLGWLAWAVGAAKTRSHLRPLALELRTKTLRLKVRTQQIMVANNHHVAGFITAPHVQLDDGQLETILLGRESLQSLFWGFLSMVRRRKNKLDLFSFCSTELTLLSSKRPLKANVDGEICETTPLDIHVWPRALKVIVPETFFNP
ncbi:MAG: YegS/Rv2252/BmrU family lipid kinase [Deinococcaceae bacterium]